MSLLLHEVFLSQLQEVEQRCAASFFSTLSESRQLRSLTLLLDTSLSMKPFFEEAKKVAAVFAWLALHSGIHLRCIPFGDAPCLTLPPFHLRDDYRRVVHLLDSLELKGTGDYYKAAVEISAQMQSATIVISDLVNDSARLFEVLAAKGGRSLLVHTFDPLVYRAPRYFSTSLSDFYSNATTEAQIREFISYINRMSAMLAMPVVRMGMEDGWLHVAHYLFHCLEYHRVG
jgi:uncharacterized protein (DUF58 family)